MPDHHRDDSDPYASRAKNTDRSAPVGVIVGVGVVVILLIGLVAFLLTGGDDDKGKSASSKKDTGASAAAAAVKEQSGVTVAGETLPEYPQSSDFFVPTDQDPAVGKTPPALTGQTFDGSPMKIDPADGHAKVVLFVAHWCPHCQREVPIVQKWIDDGNLPADVKIYTVSTAVNPQQPNYPPSKWLLNVGWTPPVLLDDADSHAALAWALPGFPYMVGLNADGTVARRGSGEVPIDQFEAMVKSLETSS